MLHHRRIYSTVELDPAARAMMTRDMELIRKIFAEIRARKDAHPGTVEIPGAEEWIVARHLELLLGAGLVEGSSSRALGPNPPIVVVTDLTMAGHDFAATLSNDGVWEKLKKSYSPSELATLPLRIVQSVATDLLMQWAKAKAGL
jgi:hypothetical protein